MLNYKRLASFLCLFVIYQTAFSQLGFSNSIGVVAGTVEFRSDYGVRDNESTNFGNSGFGIGIIHYMNFSYKRNYNFTRPNTYFDEHFKIRNEISFNTIKLNHFGAWVDPLKTSEDAKRLRGHEGKSTNLDLGTELEFFPLEIHDFETFGYKYAPFISLGVHYTYFSPKVSTTYANPDPTAVGDVTNPSNFYSLWEPGSVDASPGSTFSLVTSVGVRYKLNRLADLMLNLRWQYYFNDSVDGLDHQLASNKYNDWLLWLNVGYIYYLD